MWQFVSSELLEAESGPGSPNKLCSGPPSSAGLLERQVIVKADTGELLIVVTSGRRQIKRSNDHPHPKSIFRVLTHVYIEDNRYA